MKRIIKYLFRSIFIFVVLLFFVISLLYLPAVQRYVKVQAEDYLTLHLDWEASIGNFSVGFPLNIKIDSAYAKEKATGDTVFYAEQVKLDVGIRNVFWGQLSLDDLLLLKFKLALKNDTSGLRIKINVDSLRLQADGIDLGNQRIEVGDLVLANGSVKLVTPTNTTRDTVKGKPFDWSIAARRIVLRNVDYQMESAALPYLAAGIGSGAILRGEVNLGKQYVNADMVEIRKGYCFIRTAVSTDKKIQPVKDTVPVSAWTVRTATVMLEDNTFNLTSGDEKKIDIILSGIGIRVDSVYNRGTVVRGKLKDLKLVQQNGVRIDNMRAGIQLDSADTRLTGVYIKTPNSQIRLDASAAGSLTGLITETPVRASLNARIGLEDITPFYDELPKGLREKYLDINTDGVLSDNQIIVNTLQIDMPGSLRIDGKGGLSSIRNLNDLSGDFSLSGTLSDASFLSTFFKGGITIPRDLIFACDVKVIKGLVMPKVSLCQGGGCLAADASYNMPTMVYDAAIKLNNFGLNHFMPDDSLGMVSAELRLAGKGFAWNRMEARLLAEIGHFVYKGYDYHDIRLTGNLKKTRLSGRLNSEDPYARFDISLRGDSIGGQYAVEVEGSVGRLDLFQLNLAQSELAASMDMNIKAAIGKQDTYSLYATLKNLQLTQKEQVYKLGDLSLNMDSEQRKTALSVNTGDFSLMFSSDTALFTTVKMFSGVIAEGHRQFFDGTVDMNVLHSHLPVFTLRLNGGENNIFSKYLRSNNILLNNIELNAISSVDGPLRLSAEVKNIYLDKVQFDSVKLEFLQRDNMLDYAIGIGNSAERFKDILNMNISGTLQKNNLSFFLKQKDSRGQVGFDAGFNLTLRDSTVSLSLFPMTPIMGYQRWILNADNRIALMKDGKMKANLRLSYQDKLIDVQSLQDEGEMQDRLQVKINGVDLGNISKAIPFIPDISGVLNTDLLLYTENEKIAADGHIKIMDFYYTDQKVGTIDLDMNYAAGSSFSDHAIHFELGLDSIKRILAEGKFYTSEENKNIALDLDILSLPLYLIDIFIPGNIMHLDGGLSGTVNMHGTFNKPLVNGDLRFRNGKADLVMLGTTFELDSSVIGIKNSKVLFNDYRFMAPNTSSLAINGNIDLASFSDIMANLSVAGNNFQLVNVKQNPHSLVYGKAYANVDVHIKGGFSALDISGNVNLLNNTVLDYTLRNSAPELRDKSLDLVRFVSFSDTTLTQKDMFTNRISANGLNLKLLVEIGNNVNMNVNLSEDGENKVAIQGGGNLIYSMNQEGGNTLIGKYILTGGTVRYGVPIVGQKLFSIQNGSYVEWTGNLLNPILNISASESVRINVMETDQASRLVNFESIIRIQNSLEQPEITFDLSAPSDMSIQNQLATFSPEERTKQAMNLLIYGTYTGPGAITSVGGTANNTLNNFVESELNQWARKYLKNTGLTFGVDSYNQYSSSGEETKRTDYSYQFNKQLFNDRVSVKIGGRLSTDNEPGNNMEQNLVDDIAIEYVFDKSRNLYLKVFRHTNYESVLEGEVTQTGVGIVLRKSFRKVKDLFIRKSKREEKNKELQEKKQLKQEERNVQNDTVK